MLSKNSRHGLIAIAILLSVSSAVVPLRVSAQGAAIPVINNPLVPATVAPGGPGFILTLNGMGFAQGSVVNWNGSPRSTTFVSQSQLTAAVSASDVAAPGAGSVTVVNPNVGTVSNVAFLSVAAPVSSASFASTGPRLIAQAIGDFNGDGKLDLAGINCEPECDGQLYVYLGNGDGTFQSATTFPFGVNSSSSQGSGLAIGDFNGDGKLDVAVASGCDIACSSGTITVLMGNGDGTFQAPSALAAVGDFPNWITVADFNGDGKLDVAVTNGSYHTISILLGKGDGTFQPQTVLNLPPAGTTVAGDFNGDGKMDLVFASGPTTGVSILLGNGDGTFQLPTSFPTAPWDVSSIARG